ncbi:MAG TPA: hypothetical protein VGL35_06895 [Rhizomicrobium sp.]
MPRTSRRSVKTSLFAMLAAALLAAVPGRVFAQKFASVSLPIPVQIDSRQVRCPLYLKLELKRYGTSFDKFSAGPLDKARAMFVTVVQAIRKRDAAEFASVWTSPDQMKRLSRSTTVSLVENSAGNWMDMARSNFDFGHLTVVAEVLVGSETMFVWEAPTNSGTRRDAFYVGSDEKNRTRVSVVSSNAPVLALIETAFDEAGMPNGRAYEALPNIHLAYHYPIPLAGKGNPGSHPVYLEFDGSPMDFPVGDARVKPPTPLLAFMRKAALDLRSGNADAFSGNFTPRGRELVKQWLAEIARRNQATRLQRPAAGRNPETAGMRSVLESNVKFVLNAAPVFLVFQATAPGNSWKPDSLTYSYVVRERGTYRIANFSASDDLDDFLQNPALFDKTVLKSPPALNRTPN